MHFKMKKGSKKWFVDTLAASVFYSATYLPVYLFLGYPDWYKVGLGVMYTAVGELFLGGFLGRFIDWFRSAAGVTQAPLTPSPNGTSNP